jgi:hypothetical protein
VLLNWGPTGEGTGKMADPGKAPTKRGTIGYDGVPYTNGCVDKFKVLKRSAIDIGSISRTIPSHPIIFNRFQLISL